MALSYINNKEIKFGSAKPLNGVYTPGSPTREYEPLDSLGIYLNSGIPLSYGAENGRYMSMSDEFAATSQGNSYSFNQLFAAQMMLGFKLHDRFIACDTEHKIIGTEPLLHKAYLAEITEKTLDYFKIKIYGEKTRTFCIRMSSSEVPTSYVDLTNSFDENGLNLTQTDRQSFLSYYRFYPLTARDPSSRDEETLGVDYYLLPSAEGLGELSGDILSKFNAFISSDGSTLTSLGNTAFAYAGDIDYIPNYRGETSEAAVSAAESARVILGQVEEMHADINQLLPEMEENLELTKQYRDEAMSTEIGTVREDLNQLKGDLNEIINDGKNLFDSSKITDGYIVNQNIGILTANASHKVSDYISIIPSTSYTISVKSLSVGTTAQIRYFQYDENKTPIASSGGIDSVGKEITFVSDVSAKYVRFSYVIYSSEVMLEKGESATEYEEYIGKYINPKKIDSYTKEQSDKRYCAVPEIFKINLPEKIYATVGIELNIYFDNIVDTHDTDYLFDVTCDKGMHLERCYRYTPNSEDVGSYPITLSVTNNHGQTVEKTSTIIVTAETIFPEKTVKILILGDSTTAGGTTVEKIHKNFENTGITIQTIGTRGTAPYNHEGRSGWSAGTYLGYEEVGGVPNAFYNNGFDAPYYFSKNSIDFPDWFIINLGINDIFPYTEDVRMNVAINNFIKNINTMIASIKSASSSIKVGIALPIPPNYSQDAFGKAYKCGQTRMRYKRNNFYLVNKLIETYSGKENTENIYLIPIYTNLDTINNMGFEEIKVNARNTTTYKSPIGNGGVHPVESGYWQTADVYTGFIKATI